jgi:hypothetical protein
VSKGIAIQRLCQATDADFRADSNGDTGWIFANNHREESLVVSFETPVFINHVHIYESLNPGSIVKLELMNPKTSTRVERTRCSLGMSHFFVSSR